MMRLVCPHIWYSELSSIKNISLEQILTVEDYKRYNGYIDNKAKEIFLKTRSFLYLIKKNYQFESLQHTYTNKGKPYFVDIAGNRSEIEFSISHSNNYIVIALCEREAIGIDIEYKKDIDLTSEFLNLVLTPLESIALQNEINKEEFFFQLWTRKEAILKAIGSGLFINMKDVSTLFPLKSLNISTQDITFENYACSLAKIGSLSGYELIKYD